jgi:hypothetical protein
LAAQSRKKPSAVTREAVIGVALLLFGVLLLPVAVFTVGKVVFGGYAGAGYGDFFGELVAKLIGLDQSAWFLVLSPYLALQVARLGLFGWRKSATM